MPFLVDGDNLLGTWPGRTRTDEDKRWLCGALERFARRHRRRAVVVFDGPPPDVPAPSGQAHFAGPQRSADDLILERLRGEADPRGWIVVTSDRSLADRCRWLGARVERCDRFRPRLVEAEPGGKPDGPVDVDDWMRWFEDGGEG